MKQGLTYISERTGQIRYSDDAGKEQWIQQLSTYIPLEKIKRGQPVSIATDDDLKDASNGDDSLYQKLLASSDTYIVLTNPSRHTSSIGLALEYNEKGPELNDGILAVPEKIHVIGSGLYIEDKNYLNNAFTEDDSINTENYEYWPEFFNDYKNSIGKKVYVKGSTKGELTLVKEDAYLAYNNIIVIGFVTDANIKDSENDVEHGSIEVQIEGDDRGAIDSTMLEAVVGEDFYTDDKIVQVNGEKVSGTKVFALGKDDDETFKFAFTFIESSEQNLPNGFIALQRIDGATSFISTNGELTIDEILNVNNDAFTAQDRAFAQVAKYYSVVSGKELQFNSLNNKNTSLKAVYSSINKLSDLLNQAMIDVTDEEKVSLKDGAKHHITGLISLSSEQGRFSFAANDVGGAYEVYISANITKYFQGLYVASRGANYNKGYAVLADIRNKNRQNIIGVYESNHKGLIKQGEKAVFLKQGLHIDVSEPFETGATYYLGSHGNIFKVPQEFYNSIVVIGHAQSERNLLVDCGDSRQYNNGDLPVGYMKPSVKGNAEFGFWLMDGESWHKVEDAEHLFTALREWYSDGEIKYDESHNFGTSENPDYAPGFVIPKVQYQRHFDDNSDGYCPAQIKWLASAVYKEMPRTPFVRRAFTVENSVETGKRGVLPDIDITTLMIYGPDENRIQAPELETLDIKLFVDLNNSEANRNWVQIEPGFHITDNYKYYGYKWNIVRTKESTKEHPFGEWCLRAVYSGTEEYDTEDPDTKTLGICYQADPYAPPVSLVGMPAKVFVTKHDYYSRQFDVENLFKDYVKESVVDSTGTPWISNAISGQALRQDIKVQTNTNHLLISTDADKEGNIEAYINKLTIKSNSVEDEKAGLDDLRITSDLRLAAPNDNQNGWLLDYYNGILHYYNKDEASSTQLYSTIRNDRGALTPYGIVEDHITQLVTKEGGEPHGIKNTGWTGNLNANTLQGAHLGYAQYIFSQNAGDTLNTEDGGARIDVNTTLTIPYIQKYQNKYITRLGNVVKHYAGETQVVEDSILYDSSAKSTTETKILKAAGLKYDKEIVGDSKKLIESYDFNTGTLSLYDTNEGTSATINAIVNQSSSIKYKYILSKFFGKNAVAGIDDEYKDKDVSEDFVETLDEALQAIYEMPLATFKYNRDYNSKNDYFKRFFGIIVESVAATREHFKKDEITNTTSFDDVAYTYTDEERKSAAEYMNLMLDNNEVAFNTNNAIGILLKAAKETQERLLNLEVATYGKDSPTLPGKDEVNAKYDLDQKSTIAGLNRLVKALCREVFQNSDPTDSSVKGAWSGDNSDQYSRLDMLDKEVNGQEAVNDEGADKRISLKKVTTYPADASITEQKTIERNKIIDDENDNDFENGQDFISKVEYIDSDSSGSFDGINDAINRIVAKLNQLTENVNGSDKIKNRPQKLDYIRQTLETIIKDIYYDDAAVENDLESGAYKKHSLSRIDKLLQDLYNFDVTVGTEKLGTVNNTFNSKLLVGTKNEIDNDTNTFELFSTSTPDALDKIGENASIIDVIIQLIVGDEKDLLRTDDVALQDAEKSNDGYKVSENAKAATYDPTIFYHNNSRHYNHTTIIDRLNKIEIALQLLSLKMSNKLDFSTLTWKRDSEPYSNITSIDDFFNYISALTGITFEKNGFYATKRNSNIEAEKINKIQGYDNKKESLDLYNIIYDAVKRIKNNEWNLTYNNAALGTDYDDYVDSQKTKTTYEALETTKPAYTKDYTVTSNMRAILKLLYGYDLDKEDEQYNKTGYDNFLVANTRGDDFTKSPSDSGISVLDELYKQLYNVPKIIGYESGTLDKFNGPYTAAHYDPMLPRSVNASDYSLLGNGLRSKFIAQKIAADETTAPLNRIDILENEMKAVWNYVGFGSNQNANYFSGRLTFDELTNKEDSLRGDYDTGRALTINGLNIEGLKNVYSELSSLNTGKYQVSSVALQAYFNSVDIANRLGTDNKQFVITANETVKAETNNQKIENATSIDVNSSIKENSTYVVVEALQNALLNIKNIDAKVVFNYSNYLTNKDDYLYNRDRLWAVLGADASYDENSKNTFLKRIESQETVVGNKDESLTNDATTVWNWIKLLNDRLGNENSGENAKGNTYQRILDAQSRLTTAENDIDSLETATSDRGIQANAVDYEDKDSVYKKIELKTPATAGNEVVEIIPSEDKMASQVTVDNAVQAAVKELQFEMSKAIINNRKYAALMAYMRCDAIYCNGTSIQFARSSDDEASFSLQNKNLVFKCGENASISNEGFIVCDSEAVTFCGEKMIKITFTDNVDHIKFADVYVNYSNSLNDADAVAYFNQNYDYLDRETTLTENGSYNTITVED